MPASAVVTSLPDGDSLSGDYSYEEYQAWFCWHLGKAIQELLPENGLLFLCQTESLFKGQRTMKIEWSRQVAQQYGLHLAWHKVFYFGEPSSGKWANCTHGLCFSRQHVCGVDSLSEVELTSRATHSIGFVEGFMRDVLDICDKNGIKIMQDPFCGFAEILLTAWKRGYGAIGSDIVPCAQNPWN